VAFLVHGYISSADEFSELAGLLSHGGAHGEPLHVHRFDFGLFSRVGSDHNTGVETLGRTLGEAVETVQTECPVCRSWADEPVDVTLIGRSLGGYVVREALLQDVASQWGPWEVDRVITLASPLYGSTLTRYSTGFLSVIINGGIRTALFGFIQPERGGAFGRVVDAQVRAMRLGSPYQLHAHDRMSRWVDTSGSPPWLIVPSLGTADPVHSGDGVVRWSAANIAPVFPEIGAQTLPVVVKHGQIFAGEPASKWTAELDRAVQAIRHFVDHGTIAKLPGVAPYTWTDGALERVSASRPPPSAVWLPTHPEAGRPIHRRYPEVAEADLSDVWIRVFAGPPGAEARPLTLRDGLSPLQASTEWSRQWFELSVASPDETGSSVVAVQPVGSRHVFLPDVTPSGAWRIGLTLDRGAPVSPDHIQTRVNGGAVHHGDMVEIASLQNNVVDVFVALDDPSAAKTVTHLSWHPPVEGETGVE